MIFRRWLMSLAVLASTAVTLVSPQPVGAVVPMGWQDVPAAEFSGETIWDIAVSPRYALDQTIFAITYVFDGDWHFYLWRTVTGGTSWQQILSLPVGGYLDHVVFSPDYGQTGRVLYLMGGTADGPLLRRSIDGGTVWVEMPTPAGTADAAPIAVASDDVVFLAANATTPCRLYTSIDGGISYTSASLGEVYLTSIAVSPSYSTDHSIFLATDTGQVSWSTDGGATINTIYTIAPLPVATTYVAADAHYSANHTIYAVSSDTGGGIYSFVIGQGPWRRLDTATSATETFGAVAVSSAGVLYSSSFRNLNVPPTDDGGLYRCIDTASPAVFESRLADSATARHSRQGYCDVSETGYGPSTLSTTASSPM